MRALQIRVAVLGIDGKRALDQLAPLAQRGLEALGPVVGDFVLRDEQLRIGKADIGVGKLRVQTRRALEMADGITRVGDAIVRLQAAPLQEGKIGVEIFRSLAGQAIALLRIEAELERARHLQRDLVLDFEDIAGRPIEAHRPDIGARLRIDELSRHPHPRPVALHATLEQETRAQLLADLARVLLLVAEGEGRGPRNDLELRQVRELVQHRFGDAERENLALGGGAQVLERQHRDGRARGTRTRQVRLAYQEHGNRDQQEPDDRDVGIPAQPVDGRPRDALRAPYHA